MPPRSKITQLLTPLVFIFALLNCWMLGLNIYVEQHQNIPINVIGYGFCLFALIFGNRTDKRIARIRQDILETEAKIQAIRQRMIDEEELRDEAYNSYLYESNNSHPERGMYRN